MSVNEEVVKIRLGVLTLAAELKNISLACRIAGVSRSFYYRTKGTYETQGRDGIIPRVRRTAGVPPAIPPEMETLILMMTQQYPTISYVALAARLKLDGIKVLPSMVRTVWHRHGLTTRSARVLWLGRDDGMASSKKTGLVVPFPSKNTRLGKKTACVT